MADSKASSAVAAKDAEGGTQGEAQFVSIFTSGAEPVIDDIDHNTASGSPLQGFADQYARIVERKNISFQIDLDACRVDGADQGGIETRATVQQRNLVAVGKGEVAQDQASCSSVTIGAWSDRRAQGPSLRTSAISTRKPRT